MSSKLNWSQQEENLLRILREEQQISSWKKIAELINEKFVDCTRNGKQCRDRYINYVRFNQEQPKIIGWSQVEDSVLFDKFCQFGPKWVRISSEMPGKSQNSLKNRFYGALRKISRKIAKIQKDIKPKPRKLIKQKQIMSILEDCGGQFYASSLIEEQNSSKFPCQLYNKLLQLALSHEEQFNHQQVKNVVLMIYKYNNLRHKTFFKKASTEAELSSNQTEEITVQLPSNQPQMKEVRQEEKISLQTAHDIDKYLCDNSLMLWQNPFNEVNDEAHKISNLWQCNGQFNENYQIFNSHCQIPEAHAFFF